MNYQISREEALNLIQYSSKYEHLLRVGYTMKKVAVFLQQDFEEWEIVGFLHDYDFDLTFDSRGIHGLVTAEIFEGQLSEEALKAIKSHDYLSGHIPRSMLSKMLISVDALDAFLELIIQTKKDMNLNSLIEEINNWNLPKPWLKQLIENVKEFDISLKLFLQFGLDSYQLERK